MFRNILATVFDTDGDGEISAEELEKASESLKKLDTNKDGVISADELRPQGGPGGPGGFGGGRPGGQGGPGGGGFGGPGGGGPGGAGGAEEMVKRIMEYDENKDGKVTTQEVPARMQGMVGRADTDNDGAATRDELMEMAKGMTAGGGRGPGGFGGPPGGGFGGPPGGGFGGPPGGGPPGGGPPGGGPPGGGAGGFVERMFEFDADKDGKLSREELAVMAERFQGGRGGPGQGQGGPPRRPRLEE